MTTFSTNYVCLRPLNNTEPGARLVSVHRVDILAAAAADLSSASTRRPVASGLVAGLQLVVQRVVEQIEVSGMSSFVCDLT